MKFQLAERMAWFRTYVSLFTEGNGKQFVELIAVNAALKIAVKDVQKQKDTLLVVTALLLSVINQVAKTTLLHTRDA